MPTRKQVDAVREFNRFHTCLVGQLNEHLLDSGYSLPQARVLSAGELLHARHRTVSWQRGTPGWAGSRASIKGKSAIAAANGPR